MASLFRCVVVFVLFVCSLLFLPQVFAEDCDTSRLSSMGEGEVVAMMQKCQSAWNQMEAAKKPHVDALRKMEADIKLFQLKIKSIEADVIKKTAAIVDGEKELSGFMTLATRRIATLYRRTVSYNPLLPFLTGANVGSVLRAFTYQHKVINEDKKAIAQTAVSIQGLQTKKVQLESQKTSLAFLKEETDKRAISIRKLVGDAEAYQSKLTSAIGALSQRQHSFLAQKLAGLGIPLFAISGGGCSSDLTNGKNPTFSGGFGFFTFGVPNRVGLNQYGAWGRAKANQDYDTILKAYYNFDSIEHRDATINVDGYGPYSLDNYVKRVYEVPASWTDHDSAALKAQAIAIRSYALAYTNNGQGSICTTQQCQVFKPDPKTDNNNAWIKAVDDTAGLTMVQGGKPIKAFFSSTHGGYVYNTGDLQGWTTTSYTKRAIDTTGGSVGSFSDLRNNAYDKDSPWFYCDWGGRSSEGGTAWLRPSEVADIVNVLLLAKLDGSSQSHLSQTDKPNPDGVDTWDASTVRSKLGSTAYDSISSISVSADFGMGKVTSVTVSGDGKTNSFDGNDFKTFFNLRAPSNIQIVGPLYNIEKK